VGWHWQAAKWKEKLIGREEAQIFKEKLRYYFPQLSSR
jgi:hypothetical protein